MCVIWQEVLGLERVGVTDDFFRIGGDSILSIRIVAKEKKINPNARVADILRYRTIREILKHSQTSGGTQSSTYIPFSLISETFKEEIIRTNDLETENTADIYPAGYLQSGMLIESTAKADPSVYHDVFSYRIMTVYEPGKFEKAWQQLAEKNEQLRTAFIESEQGYLNVIYNKIAISSKIVLGDDDTDIREIVDTEKYNGFDFTVPGLFRLLIMPDDLRKEFTLIFSFHHAITDGWSVASLINEFVDAYVLRKAIRKEKKPQYAQFVSNEQKVLSDAKYKQFWQAYLEDYELKQRVFREDPPADEQGQVFARTSLSQDINNKILSLAQQLKVTPDSMFMGIYNLVLGTYYNTDDVVIGTVANNRLEEEGGDRVFGLHLNTIPLRFDRKAIPDASGKEYFSWVFKNRSEVNDYKLYPYGKIKSDQGLAEDIYRCAFNYVHFHVGEENYAKQAFALAYSYEKTNIPLTLNVQRYQDKFHLSFDGSPGFIDEATAEKLLNYTVLLLERVINHPERKVNQQHGLSAAEQSLQLESWNNTEKAYPDTETIHGMFEQQAAKHPGKTALVYEGQTLSYGELNERSNALARHIRKTYQTRTGSAMPPDTLIALLLERSLEMVV
ncbi:condensation domain-containing protein, partial [Mucilaginibacter calamicampi]